MAVVDVAEEVFLRTEDINQAGGETEAYRTDLTDLKATRSMVAKILERFGLIDILVNVAGKSVPSLLPSP